MQIGSESLPFGPFIEALRGLTYELPETELADLLGTGRSEFARLIPHLLPAGAEPVRADVSDGSSQGRLFEYVLLFLERLAGRAPLLLVVEDIHWADRSTLELLAFLVRNLREGPIVLLATYRSDELDRRDPLVEFLGELERAGRAERVDLHRFDDREIASQLQGILGVPPDSDLVAAVAARSEGNAFYAEELLAARDLGRRLPDTLRDVLLARIARLSEPTQEFVRVAAAGGARVWPTVLNRVTAMEPAAIETALRESVAHHILVARDATAEDSYAFRHALVQEAMYGELLPGERIRLHAAFAEALAGPDEVEAEASRAAEIAYHLQAAGNEPRALEAWIRAGTAAEAMYAFADAGVRFEHALDLWDRVPNAAALAGFDRIDLYARAAAALESTAPSRSLAHARSALELLEPVADPTRAGLLHARVGDYATILGDGETALAAYREAVRLVPVEPPSAARAQVLTELARFHFYMYQPDESLTLGEEAVQVARTVGARKEESQALIPLAYNLVARGEVETGLASAHRARQLAEEIGDVFGAACALTNTGGMLMFAARYEEAVSTSFEAYAYAAGHGLSGRFGSSNLAGAGRCLVELGRWDEAADVFARSQRVVGIQDTHSEEDLLLLDARRGEFAAADRRAERFRSRATSPFYEGSRIAAGLAELALWQGDPRTAREVIRSRTTYLDAQPQVSAIEVGSACSLGLRAEADLAALARRNRSASNLRAALENGATLLDRMRVRGKSTADSRPHYVPQVEAWLATCEAEFSRLEGRSDSNLWARAVSAWEALRRPYDRAYALMREGEAVLAGRRDRKRAARVLTDAREVAVQLGAEPLRRAIEALARRPGIRVSERAHDGLSQREREVLALIAAGRSNREIGETLFITKKTASVHVANIKAKLGAQSRIEIAALAIRRRMVETAESHRT